MCMIKFPSAFKEAQSFCAIFLSKAATFTGFDVAKTTFDA